jgi:hypothetical protein
MYIRDPNFSITDPGPKRFCAADAAFRAEQLKVAISDQRWAVSRGAINIKKKGQMSCN